MNIANLEAKIAEADSLLSLKEEQDSSQSNFAMSLSINSLKSHVEELQFQLKTAKEQREKEVIELRLIGADVNNGSVPLDILGNLSKTFSDLISSSSARINLGRDIAGIIPLEITQPLNLRFADIGQGSSKLYITGDTSPDLFGDSLLENSLTGLFELLNKDLNEGLSDQVHYMGLRSTHNLAKFLKVLRKKNIELDLTWRAPNQTKHEWVGRHNKILTLEKLLDGFSTSDPVSVVVSGMVDLISRSGKIEIRGANDEEVIRVLYSRKLYAEVRKLRLGDNVRLDTKETTVYNQATQEEKKKYSLVAILWDNLIPKK